MLQERTSDPETLLGTAIGAEGGLARLEGLLVGDPRLAKLWSSETILVEAVRSVGLEDIRIRESDLFLRISSDRAPGIDPRGVETAMITMRLLQHSPDILGDPVAVIRNLEHKIRLRAPSLNPDEAYPVEELPNATLNAIIQDEIAFDITPGIAALRAATRYSIETDGIAPSIERMIITLVDQALRHGRAEPEEIDASAAPDNPVAAFIRPGRRLSICLPATALTWSGSSTWSLRSPTGIQRCLQALRDHARRELGTIGVLRHWITRMETMRGTLHGRSHLGALLDLVFDQPVLTSRMVVDQLGVSRRSAINLLNEATDHGMLKTLTNRRVARIWGTPMMAERLRTPDQCPRLKRHAKMARPSPHDPGTADTGIVHEQQPLRDQNRDRIQSALDALDAALANADQLITRSKTHRERRDNKGPPWGQ